MTVSVFIDGAAGTTGLEIRERLAGRDEIALIALDDAQRKDAKKRAEALNAADFVILCLPDDAAREAVALIDNPRTRVIDASTAHRVADGWTYGFPELEPAQAQLIADAPRVSNPGCWPTGFLALVRPLVRAGLVPPEWSISAGGASGYSGGGKAMIAEFEDGTETTGFRAYGLDLDHKHLPEMQKHARMEHPPIFLPAVARAYRGMLIEVPLALYYLPRKPSPAQIAQVLADAYRDSPVVRVVEDDGETRIVRLEEDAGSDRLSIRVFGSLDRNHARLIATLDNLGKGAAGAAVQNLNIMAGFDQTAGLVL
ncbi:N-acetyl-gamma-glutamyl-phosphate reductase [Sphingomonas sp. ST-64]|uniref:N-acetyl-gamma-glutamyl-phosphate reductase n=1 Tax=Sphingomonas plantiphila TaxID=3163295 RepID=A0ABW8YRA0_9SPHN